VGKGDKVYALLRETLLKTGRAGIARVVIQTKQHLAALVPVGPALVLNLLRWGEAVRGFDQLALPPAGSKEVGLKERELAMAEQLVDDMTTHWEPSRFHDSFTEEVMKLVHKKVEAGETERVTQPEAEEAGVTSSNIVDLTELLQRSLQRGGDKEGDGRAAKPKARAPMRSAPATRDTKPAPKGGRPHAKRRAA
jgi:DNA end-binding protein Ku